MQLGDLRRRDRRLIEHAVYSGGPVAIRGDLRDEEQAVGHASNVAVAFICSHHANPTCWGNGKTSERPVRVSD